MTNVANMHGIEQQTGNAAMEKQEAHVSRRSFLVTAVSIPALAVTALLTRQSGSAPVMPSLPTENTSSTGYHETEHIRQYYRSAAF